MMPSPKTIWISIIYVLIPGAVVSAETLLVQNGQTIAGRAYNGTETAWIHSGVPDNVVGTNAVLRVGYQDDGATQFRTLIRFGDLSASAGVSALSLGFTPDQITGATLTLYQRGSNPVGNGSAELSILDPADNGWTDGQATWNRRRKDLNEPWSQGPGIGNAFGPAVGLPQPFTGSSASATPITFDITASAAALDIVRSWFAPGTGGGAAGGTFLLRATDETGTGDVYHDWYSEDQNAGNELLMPRLEITYDPDLNEHPANFGRDWIRARPLNIFAWGGSATDAYYHGANFNALLSQSPLAARRAASAGLYSHAIPLDLRGVPLTQQVKDDISAYINAAGPDHALMITDEPRQQHFAHLGDIAAWVRQTYPQTLVYVNLLPVISVADPDAYVDEMVATIKPDILMHDQYPVFTGGLDRNYHFSNVTHYRNKGLEHNLPNYAYIQSFKFAPGYDPNRLPSESQLRMMLFSYLTAGYKGFAYFKYNTSTAIEVALLNQDSSPSVLYAPAAAANAEVIRLGTALRFLETTDLRFIPGSTAPPAPQGLSNWSFGAGSDTRLTGVSVDLSDAGNAGTRKDGLLGHFIDDDGQQYFMLTNLYEGNDLSASATAIDFILTFTNDIVSIFRLNRVSGEPERIDLEGHVARLTLPGGTGDLFKYDNGFFPGILPGDANLDQHVDLLDLQMLATHYGLVEGGLWSKGDFNLDGDVDLSDLATLAAHYTGGQAAAFADFQRLAEVPEPGCLGATGIAWLLLRRRGATSAGAGQDSFRSSSDQRA